MASPAPYSKTPSEQTSLLPKYQTTASSKLSEPPITDDTGSSIAGCTFNFTNSIVGAGCIGLGGAMAQSGGFISLFSMLFFAYLSKESFDILIRLSLNSSDQSYEDVSKRAFGTVGLSIIVISRFLYAFGCLVAYIKIIKDNLSSSLEGLFSVQWDANECTLAFCALIMLPLCLLRDMTPLERVSMLKIAIVVGILGTVLYLYPSNHVNNITMDQEGSMFQEHWLKVRPSTMHSLGTFVFTFVAHHIVHLTFASLHQNLQTLVHWRQVSTNAVALSTALSVALGLAVYMTFWEDASSNMLVLYHTPSMPLSLAKGLLSAMMMLTYPLPFLTCRELLVWCLPSTTTHMHDKTGDTTVGTHTATTSWYLLPNQHNQFILPLHILTTLLLWSISTALALAAPSLGDVLDLVGCATGTIIAYILPAACAVRLEGWSFLVALILVVGGFVGVLGTYGSCVRLWVDSGLDG